MIVLVSTRLINFYILLVGTVLDTTIIHLSKLATMAMTHIWPQGFNVLYIILLQVSKYFILQLYNPGSD